MTSARTTLETMAGALATVARATLGLELLLVYGSRARGEARSGSDWDFGFLGRGVDHEGLLADLVEAVGSDRVDLVDLDRASGLLRFRAAREGRVVYAAEEGVEQRFRLEAARFWCDAEPVLRRGYESVLAGIGSDVDA